MEQENGAIYCRLSQDDGSAGESGSIQTQKTLLTQYCKEHGIHIADYYCDDGWSGTNFERPEFKRMINDIESGRINTVIVKDLSRFGREYAQMGLYIEHYFEQKGVRFIAVAEGVDSKNGLDNLMLPMTNVINSLYARQASTKTKAAHRARASSGMYMGSHAPFGYQKDPKDRHHLIVDPDAADVVKDIFQMFADGIGYVRMTKILRERKVLNPQAYFNQNNPDYYKNSDYWRKPFDWHATSVRVILNNPVSPCLTLEYLETHGVTVIGYGTDELPAFYTRKSGFGVDYELDTPAELAKAFHVKRELGLRGGLLVTNPIPEEYSMDKAVIDKAIAEAVEDAKKDGIHGKATTPYLLAKIKDLTGGDSLDSNIQLVFNNARLGAAAAVELAKLER